MDGAIPRSSTRHSAAVDRRLAEVFSDDGVGPGVRRSYTAGDLLQLQVAGQIGEGRRLRIPFLPLYSRPVDGATVETRWRARLQTSHAQFEGVKPPAEPDSGRVIVAAGASTGSSAVNDAVEKGAGGQHHSRSFVGLTYGGDDPDDMSIIQKQVLNRGLDQDEIRLDREGRPVLQRGTKHGRSAPAAPSRRVPSTD